jgi:hypothetical protein
MKLDVGLSKIFIMGELDKAIRYVPVGEVLYHYSDKGTCNRFIGEEVVPPVFTLSTRKKDYVAALNKQRNREKYLYKGGYNVLHHYSTNDLVWPGAALEGPPRHISQDLSKEDHVYQYDDNVSVKNRIFVLPEAKYLGSVVYYWGLTVLPADDMPAVELGWLMYEDVGLAICNLSLIWSIELI